MKKSFLVFTFFCTTIVLNAQTDKTGTGTSKSAKTVATKTTVAKPAVYGLKNMNDSASYAVGVSVANFYKQQGIKNLNTSLVSKAIDDILSGKKPLLDDAAANNCMNNYMSRIQAEKSRPAIDAGQTYLAKNKTLPGIKTTSSGLQYQIIREGTGAKPVAEDSVTCHYHGTLLDGTTFDNSYERGKPITFPLLGVIPGWTEGLQLMSVGSKYKFYIPYTLGYGAFDYQSIPGGSMLTFEVELLDIKKKQ